MRPIFSLAHMFCYVNARAVLRETKVDRDRKLLSARLVSLTAVVGFINGVDNVNWPPYRDSKG